MIVDEAEESRGHDHRDAADDAALDAGDDAEGFDGQDLAMFCGDRQLLAGGAGARDLHDAGLTGTAT